MKATIDRKALVAGLKTVTPALPNGGLPVLHGVHIAATTTGIDLCCSSLHFTAETVVVDPENVTPGICIPPARLLLRIIEKLGGERVTIEAVPGNRVVVTSDETVAQIKAHDPEMWPDLPEAQGDGVVLAGGVLDDLDRILPFASVDGDRPQLCTLHFGNGDAVTTDTFRMGIVSGIPAELGPALVPIEAWKAIAKAAKGSIELTIDDRYLTARTGPSTFTTSLVEGTYPPYDRMMASLDLKHHWTVPRVALIEALGRLTALGGPSSVVAFLDGDKLRLTAEDKDVGSIEDVIPTAGDYADRLRFATKFFAEMLDALEDDEIRIEFESLGKPAVAKADALTVMVVPIRPDAAVS